ncbi:sugar O-acetyltransferase [Priestia megaterium]|uniref:sugar O-acetyltransferase n=1 Tax=Priestia megaterium TaxID=1404 RepID=UPI001C48D43B|nr:sugar O-acetyltransferase [Priestia megaterium]MBV6738218.1 sugar O-acetyltransferase [Priestia megaterium]
MNIKEKFAFMKTGKMYNDLDPDIVAFREKTVFKTNEYNQSFGLSSGVRQKILEELLGSIGKNVHFEPTLRCEFGVNIHIGDDFYANFDCVLLDAGGITIGNNVLFGPRVGLYTANHAFDAEERRNGGCFAKPIKVGNNVWVGAGVHIMPGVTIGDNTIIGSGSIVTSNIPSNVIATGSPCKVLREITEEDKTEYLYTLI